MAPSPNTITLEVRDSTYEFGGRDKSAHSIHTSNDAKSYSFPLLVSPEERLSSKYLVQCSVDQGFSKCLLTDSLPKSIHEQLLPQKTWGWSLSRRKKCAELSEARNLRRKSEVKWREAEKGHLINGKICVFTDFSFFFPLSLVLCKFWVEC